MNHQGHEDQVPAPALSMRRRFDELIKHGQSPFMSEKSRTSSDFRRFRKTHMEGHSLLIGEARVLSFGRLKFLEGSFGCPQNSPPRLGLPRRAGHLELLFPGDCRIAQNFDRGKMIRRSGQIQGCLVVPVHHVGTDCDQNLSAPSWSCMPLGPGGAPRAARLRCPQ